MMPPVVTICQASGRYNAKPAEAQKAWGRYADSDCSLIGLTEMSNKERWHPALDRFCERSGWEWAQADGGPGPRETALLWDGSVWEQVGDLVAHRLSSLRYWRAGGAQTPYFYAVEYRLRHIESAIECAVLTYHAALDNTPRRAKVQADSLKGLGRLVSTLEKDSFGPIFVLADMNMKMQKYSVARKVAQTTGLYSVLTYGNYDRVFPRGAQRGGKIVDTVLSNRKSHGSLLLNSRKGSDHHAVKASFTL